jgi:hypothetical protein
MNAQARLIETPLLRQHGTSRFSLLGSLWRPAGATNYRAEKEEKYRCETKMKPRT